jgi:hypothetical protein
VLACLLAGWLACLVACLLVVVVLVVMPVRRTRIERVGWLLACLPFMQPVGAPLSWPWVRGSLTTA